VNYDNSLLVAITVTCYSWAPSSGDHLFTCGAISCPPQDLLLFLTIRIKKIAVWKSTFVSEHLNTDQSQLAKCFALVDCFACCSLGDSS